jgi:hypothetical protein
MGDILSVIRQLLSPLAGTLRNRSGATAVAVAFALTAVLGFAGLGTEAASWYYTKRNMQGAADAAASAAAANAAKVLYQGGTPATSQFTTDAQSIAAKYGFLDGSSSTTVSAVHYQPNSGPCSVATVYCVQVAISQPQPALISGLFLSSGPTIAATAAAKANTQATDTGCVLALNRASISDVSLSGGVNMTFSNCALYDNSPLTGGSGALNMSNNATLTASAVYVSGSINTTSGITATDGIHTGVNPAADPYANVTQPTSSTTCNGWTANGNNDLHLTNSNSSATLSPASAGGTCAIPQSIKMDSSGVTLNFCPGVYVFNGGSLVDNAGSGGATINAPPNATSTPPMSSTLCPGNTTGGVTLVFANGSSGYPGSIQVNAQATINMTAPTTGATAGLAVFQARTTCPTNGSGVCPGQLQGGANQNITGAIYLPNNDISYSGGSSTGSATQCTQLIASTITFSGNSTFANNCEGKGTSAISYTQGWLAE